VLGGFGDFMLLRGVVYWSIAIVLLIITKGRLGYPIRSEDLIEGNEGMLVSEMDV
jgi:hypothetical protein